MKLLVNIDQKGAIAAGVNAPNSTEVFELDPAQITDADLRKWIAENIDLRTGEVKVGQQWPQNRPDSWNLCVWETRTPGAIVPPVTFIEVVASISQFKTEAEGAAEAIRTLTESKVAEHLAEIQRAAKVEHRVHTYRYECGAPPNENRLIWASSRGGEPGHVWASVDGDVHINTLLKDIVGPSRQLSYQQTAWERWEAESPMKAEVDAFNAQAKAAALVTARAAYAKAKAERAEQEQRKAKEQAALKSYLDGFAQEAGGLVLEKWKLGYATQDQMLELVRHKELETRDVELIGGHEDWGRGGSQLYNGGLSDGQFLALKAFKAKLPETATVELFRLSGPPESEVQDYPGGEPDEPEDLIVAEASWKVGPVRVTADCDLGQ